MKPWGRMQTQRQTIKRQISSSAGKCGCCDLAAAIWPMGKIRDVNIARGNFAPLMYLRQSNISMRCHRAILMSASKNMWNKYGSSLLQTDVQPVSGWI